MIMRCVQFFLKTTMDCKIFFLSLQEFFGYMQYLYNKLICKLKFINIIAATSDSFCYKNIELII